MEETWELVVVSESAAAEEPFNEAGLQFIKINEFALRYYLSRLGDYSDDFSESYRFLRDVSAAGKVEPINSSDIWDDVIDCADNLAKIANILLPSRKGKKDDLRVIFTKKRAEALQGLLQLSVNDRNDLVDFRNRVQHEDEDFDDWYYQNMTKAPGQSATIVTRLVTWDESPFTTKIYGCASAYDAKVGHVHFYDKHYSLHEAMRVVEFIRAKVEGAQKRLTELSGRETKVTLK